MNKDALSRRVVVTGFGAVTPLGMNAEQSWAAIMDYQLGYRYFDRSAVGIQSRFFGVIDDEPSLKGVPAAIRRRLPRFARLALGAAAKRWRWPPRGEARRPITICLSAAPSSAAAGRVRMKPILIRRLSAHGVRLTVWLFPVYAECGNGGL
ncbi:3-oxoacyl-(acyl carrier protein) synthase II [Serratia fonticola]|uniref:3-oxoacyl-(Acyl carrier protein) synthase II n=1 Tax=Serratia fonticola TaxID=47917 RepID=A0A4U9UPF2_SERFO|nr:3-oxoacyl-(acyl carrier protein) synthase II [Serratia fonticola]